MSVAALFVDPNGPYPELLGEELCWDEARDARVDDSARTHRARLERDVHRAIEQPPVAQGVGGLPHRDDFSVRGRIVPGLAQIMPAADDVSARVVDDHAPNRHHVLRQRQPRLGNRFAHPRFRAVTHRRRV